jgi:hypothetical protein
MRELIAQVKRGHDPEPGSDGPFCAVCDVEWPCPVVALCNQADAMRSRLEGMSRLRHVEQGHRDSWEECIDGLCPGDREAAGG